MIYNIVIYDVSHQSMMPCMIHDSCLAEGTALAEETTCALLVCFKRDLYLWKNTPKETLKEAYIHPVYDSIYDYIDE